jgi:hypothetical protein
MTTNEDIQKLQLAIGSEINLNSVHNSAGEELSDLELAAIAGGANQVISSVLEGTGIPLPGGKVLGISTRTTTYNRTINLPQVGNVVSSAVRQEKSIGVSYSIYDAHPTHPSPRNTIGY